MFHTALLLRETWGIVDEVLVAVVVMS